MQTQNENKMHRPSYGLSPRVEGLAQTLETANTEGGDFNVPSEVAFAFSPNNHRTNRHKVLQGDLSGKKSVRKVMMNGQALPFHGGATRDSITVCGLEGRQEEYGRTVPLSLDSPKWLQSLYRAWLSAKGWTRSDFERLNSPPTVQDSPGMMRDLMRRTVALPSDPSRTVPALNRDQCRSIIARLEAGDFKAPTGLNKATGGLLSLKEGKKVRKTRRDSLSNAGLVVKRQDAPAFEGTAPKSVPAFGGPTFDGNRPQAVQWAGRDAPADAIKGESFSKSPCLEGFTTALLKAKRGEPVPRRQGPALPVHLAHLLR